MGFLTDEDKLYLKKVSKYLQSTGVDEGIISDYIGFDDFSMGTYEWNELKGNIIDRDVFDYSFRSGGEEIPLGYRNIIKKVLDTLGPTDKMEDKEYRNGNLYVSLNYKQRSFEVGIELGYYDTKREITEYDKNQSARVIKDLLEKDINPDNEDVIAVEYNGGGDSGWIEDLFSNGMQVPGTFEDWGYLQLSINFGGWEMDEGSNGAFLINFKDGTIDIEHYDNYETSDTFILFKENF